MPESNRNLIDRYKNGEHEAFGILYERYKRPIFAYCLQLLRHRQSAEDALHETFLKAVNGIGGIENPDSFRSWIFRIARNEALSMKRSKKELTGKNTTELIGYHNPGEAVENNDLVEIITSGIDSLKPEYREVIVLREFHQLSYEEIVEVTGTTMSAVKSRLFKARKALIKNVSPHLKTREKS